MEGRPMELESSTRNGSSRLGYRFDCTSNPGDGQVDHTPPGRGITHILRKKRAISLLTTQLRETSGFVVLVHLRYNSTCLGTCSSIGQSVCLRNKRLWV